jgi:hypothetical protein
VFAGFLGKRVSIAIGTEGGFALDLKNHEESKG